MNKYETIANEVVKNIGGTENIESVTNCMTRLRFTLKNVSKVDVESLEKVKGVQGVVNKKCPIPSSYWIRCISCMR